MKSDGTGDTILGGRPHLIPCGIAALMLLSATGRHAYDFYTLLRWVVCATGIWVVVEARICRQNWAVTTFAALALLFNPIMPVHLSRGVWQPIDVVAALLFVAAAVTLRRPMGPPPSG